MNLSLLQNFNKENFFLEPFPHIVIKNALPEDLYNELHNSYPINKFINESKNNFRLELNPEQVKKDNEINNLWKNFVLFHSSKEFCHQIFDIFSKTIVDTELNFFKHKDELYNLKVAENPGDDADITSSLGIRCNTPVTKKSSTIGIHVGAPSKFIESLFYMRDQNDNAGGNLTLHSWRFNLPVFLKKVILARNNNFLNNIIRKFQFLFISKKKVIEYSPNTLVMWNVTIDALHSVSKREVTKHYRKFCYYRINHRNLKGFYDPYSIVDKALNFKNYKFF